MSAGAPEFVMPPPVPVAPIEPSAPSQRMPAAAEPRDDDPAPPTGAPPRGRSRRALLAVAAAGVVIGALAQTGVLAAADTATEAQDAALEGLAMAYLTAIAEGRAADATAIVAPDARGEVAPDAVLAAATPIREYSASVIGEVVDEAAQVLVEFTVGGVEADRLLDARIIDGRWRLLTSLAEAPDIYQGDQLAAMVLGGVEIEPTRPPLLYPGTYRAEVVDSGLFRTVGDAFVIDGDQASTPETWTGIELDMQAAVTARGLVVAIVEDCRDSAACGVPTGAVILADEEPALLAVETQGGGVTIGTRVSAGDRWFEVRLRAALDPETERTQWLCPEPARLDLPVVPCGH